MIYKTTIENFNLSNFLDLPNVYLIAIRDSAERKHDKLDDFMKISVPCPPDNQNAICLLAYTTFENALKGSQNLQLHNSKETIYANYISDRTVRIYKLDKLKEIVSISPSHSIRTTLILGCRGIALDPLIDDDKVTPGIFCPLETLLSRGSIE